MVAALLVRPLATQDEPSGPLFSISQSRWWIIAIAVSVLFVLSLRALIVKPEEYPDDLRREMEERQGQGKWVLYLVVPAALALLLGTNLLRPEPASAILFLYSAVMAAIPVAILPVRGRMLRSYIAQRQNPDAKVQADRLATAWICAVLIVVVVAAVLALMSTPYGHTR
ncbi:MULTISPECIES: hypothetical protein [Actinomadura]|uniref:Uncharacterized protein n=1 Tax=Actinomadura yumaensis TaxID=111807 RepID=A0ABW2CEI7_9ACTN|nr:hypothetical protein [Actinomadura sp. J1-007]MWK34630.1 hypothetical protein [Actinomadura sp. J1-007]